jgi:hypothetical protein
MLRKDIEEKYPFISLIQYGGKEYVGIIVNQDSFITTILDYSILKNLKDKKFFLQLGETWWMESNRMIPITIFLRHDIVPLKYCLKNLNTKDVDIIIGPTVNLGSLHLKRVKRKSIQMVRKPKKN